jgi:pilus assembly protein FimV
VLPPATKFTTSEGVDSVSPAASGLDLDLDLVVATAPAQKALENTQPIDLAGGAPRKNDLAARLADLQLPTGDANAASDTTAAAFDFGAISLDLGSSDKTDTRSPALDYASMPAHVDEAPAKTSDPSDPLLRKLELAEEFRQIGDKEGARDLLEEVVAKASGPLKARAQGLLDGLA